MTLSMSAFIRARTALSAATIFVALASGQVAMAQHSMSKDAMSRYAPATFTAGAITITAPWLRVPPKGAKVAGAYFSITNNGREADRLIGGTLARAGRFEVHKMTMDNGVMRMRPVEDGLVIKPGETIEFKPGGYHVMGLDLDGSYSAGESVSGTLRFEKAGEVTITYTAQAMGAAHSH